MSKSKSGIIGALLLVLVITLVGFGVTKSQEDKKAAEKQVTLSGFLGGEKVGLFDSKEFKDYMEKKHSTTLNYRKNGSIDMVSGDAPQGQDYLFPSSQTALGIYRSNGRKPLVSEVIFNTPIVIYSWKPVVEKLRAAGYISTTPGGVSTIDMVKLARDLKEGKKWSDVGLKQIYGSMVVSTTDPNASNSGNMFLGLLANALNGGKPVNAADVSSISKDLKAIYQRFGYMNTSSSDIFNQYLSQGMGAFPLMAGYENQLLEFSKQNPSAYSQVKDDVVMLYPTPTVWSSHVFIAQNVKAEATMGYLLEPEVQSMAWKNHGFRPAVAGGADPKDFTVPGVPRTVDNVMEPPSSEIMLKLMAAVKQ